MQRQRNEQHGKIPSIYDVVEIRRDQIGDLSDKVGPLPPFLPLFLVFDFAFLALLALLGTVSIARGWRGLSGERGGGGFIRPFDRVIHTCALSDGGGVGSGRFGRWAT